MKKISGIYEIRNKLNDKSYYGPSCDIYLRWKWHSRNLRLNKHHSILLQRAWNKYEEENFEFNIIVAVDSRFLFEEEQKYLDNNQQGYNICLIAGGGMKGLKHTPEALKKISEASKGNKHCCGKEPVNKGQKMSPEIYKKYMAGRPEMTEEYRQKIIEGRKKTYELICPNGHNRTNENTKLTKEGWKYCLDCRKIQNTKRRERRKVSKLRNKENRP